MSGFSLYQISDDYLSAFDALSHEDLPDEAIADTLEGIAGAWEDKAVNVARYIRNIEAEADAVDGVIKGLQERKSAADKQADRLRAYLLSEMKRTGLTAKAPDIEIKTAKNPPSLIIEDESLIPDDYIKQVTLYQPDKQQIRKAIQENKNVPGTRLEQKERLVIR